MYYKTIESEKKLHDSSIKPATIAKKILTTHNEEVVKKEKQKRMKGVKTKR